MVADADTRRYTDRSKGNQGESKCELLGAVFLLVQPTRPFLAVRSAGDDVARWVPEYEKPLFELKKHISTPVKIESIELLSNAGHYFVRSRSTDGAVGIARTKQIKHYIPILLKLVAPRYIGRDARDIERLVDDVYRANYKIAGQPFWCPVAYVEQSLFDLLGKVANKPAGELMGGVIRHEIPVYLSGSGRATTAEEEVDVFASWHNRVGARLSGNSFVRGARVGQCRDPRLATRGEMGRTAL